jgi:hypothetical protein
MGNDVILTLITLVVAVIGTLLKDPPRAIKIFLIALAIATSVASIFKAHEDSAEKDFLKSAITATLTPSNSAYDRFYKEIDSEAETIGLNQVSCYHDDPDGMVCFISSDSDPHKHGTLVIDRSEVAQMYAHDLQKTSNKKFIAGMLSQPYDPSSLEDAFENKVGLLGAAVIYTQANHWPNYSYDDNGKDLKLTFDQNGSSTVVNFSSEELRAIKERKAVDVFYDFEQRLQGRFSKPETPGLEKGR